MVTIRSDRFNADENPTFNGACKLNIISGLGPIATTQNKTDRERINNVVALRPKLTGIVRRGYHSIENGKRKIIIVCLFVLFIIIEEYN